MKLGDNVPVWVREKRQPTREELAGKHAADGGGMNTASGNTLPDDAETELVELFPGTWAYKPIPAADIKVKRYNT